MGPLLLIFDIGSDFLNGYGFLNASRVASNAIEENFPAKNHTQISPDGDGQIYGLITIGVAWLPGLFYALVLACCMSGSFCKRIWISILAMALAPIFPIILGFIIAASIIPEKYSSEKIQNLFILCALLEGAMESSVQINLQGYIMNREQKYLKDAPPTILTVDPDGRNSYIIAHYQILLVSIVISIFNQGTASIKSFTSLANIIKTKCGLGKKDTRIEEISTIEFLILIFFLIISQIFRTGSLILLYSTMEFFAIIPIVFIFVNNIILLGPRLHGFQSNALVVNCKNIICSDHAKVYYLGTLGPLSRSNKNKYWSSSNDEYAIWFDENFENWKIGLAKNRGTSKCAMYSIDQNHEDDTTSPVGKSWMYWNGQIWVKDEDIKVEEDPGLSVKKSPSVYVLLNALINVPMVGFFNKEIDFLKIDNDDVTDDTGPSQLNNDRKRKNLQDTLYLVKKLIKTNNAILLIFLIISAVLFVNSKFINYTLNPNFLTSEDNGYLANMSLGILAILFFISTGLSSSINNNFSLNWRKLIQNGMTVSIMAVIVWKLISYWGKNTDEKSFTKLMKDCDLSSCIPYDGPEYFEESPISDIESYFTEDSSKKYITLVGNVPVLLMTSLLILTINAIHFAFSEVRSYFKTNLLVLLVMSALAVWNGFIMFWDTNLLELSIENTFKTYSNVTTSTEFQPKMMTKENFLCTSIYMDEQTRNDLKCDSDLWISAVWIEISLILYCVILFIFFIHKFFSNLCQCCSYCWNCTIEQDQKNEQAVQKKPYNPNVDEEMRSRPLMWRQNYNVETGTDEISTSIITVGNTNNSTINEASILESEIQPFTQTQEKIDSFSNEA